jgi:chromosomal replication initiator protein
MGNIWDVVKTSIKQSIPEQSYSMWIDPLFFEAWENDHTLTLSTLNLFSRKRIFDHFMPIIESELEKAIGKSCKLNIIVREKQKKNNSDSDTMKPDTQMVFPEMNFQPYAGRLLRRDFTFDNFVVGGNNDFAYSAALCFASKKLPNQSSLFFISRTGMGKSHLSQAVGHYILSSFPSERVYYATAEDFTNEMVLAFKHNALDKFKEKYRSQCDTLLLEDVHFLTGKDRTQIELAHALDYLLDARKKVIFSSCLPPTDIPKLNDQLRSRISSGLMSQIDPPDFKTRVRILKRKAKVKGLILPGDVIEYLAGELTDDIRQLESGLIGVFSRSSLLGETVSLSMAEGVVKTMVKEKKQITIDAIKKLVCKEYKISEKDIVSRSRKQAIVRPRQIAIYLARKYTDCPLQTIGKSFSRYHATALHSIGAIEKELKQNAAIQKQVEFLRKKLETGNF